MPGVFVFAFSKNTPTNKATMEPKAETTTRTNNRTKFTEAQASTFSSVDSTGVAYGTPILLANQEESDTLKTVLATKWSHTHLPAFVSW